MRDAKVVEGIKKAGWKVEIVWECEAKDVDQVRERLVNVFELRSQLSVSNKGRA